MKLFIGCSSSKEIDQKYLNCSKILFSKLFKIKTDLVFGAVDCGIMGEAYKEATKNNRKIIGITPKLYKDNFKELKCDEEFITDTVSHRTDLVINKADILLFLPGGVGTCYELFTAVEKKRSNECDKPIIIYNYNNYFDNLLDMFEKIYNEKFTDISVKSSYFVSNDYKEILNYIDEFMR